MVAMTPAVYEVFKECWEERRLDTSRVFLYNHKPIVSGQRLRLPVVGMLIR